MNIFLYQLLSVGRKMKKRKSWYFLLLLLFDLKFLHCGFAAADESEYTYSYYFFPHTLTLHFI